MRYYNDEEANKVAETFFKYYYQDRGKKKWGGYFLSEHRKSLRDFHEEQRQQGILEDQKGIQLNQTLDKAD